MGKGRLEAFSDGVLAIILPLTMATYGFVTLMAGFAYYVLQREIIKQQGAHSVLALALGRDWKGKALPLAYLAAIPLAFVRQWIAGALYVAVALIWLVPVRRIARVLDDRGEGG